MGQPPALDRVGERAHHWLLTDQFAECLWPILAGKDPIRLRRRLRGFDLVRRCGFGNGRPRRLARTTEQGRLAGSLKLRGARLRLFAFFPWRLVAENVA